MNIYLSAVRQALMQRSIADNEGFDLQRNERRTSVYICPHCASENFFFSKKRKLYICEDCDNGFEKSAVKRGMRVFISYGHDENAGLVHDIKDYLNNNGFDVWIDSSEIPPGKD